MPIVLEANKLQSFYCFFIPFVLNFDVTRYFNSRLLLVVCNVQILHLRFLQILSVFFEALYLAVNNNELQKVD